MEDEISDLEGNISVIEGEDPVETFKRKIMCWKCQTIVLAELDWEKVKCPICKKINDCPPIELNNKNIDNKISPLVFLQYMLVGCPFCKFEMKTKKESDYVICSKCKNTIIIAKDNLIPTCYNGLDPVSYMKFKLGPMFNPYQMPQDHNLHLFKGFERDLIEQAQAIVSDMRKNKMNEKLNSRSPLKERNPTSPQRQNIYINKYEVYKPLTETINEITENIKKLNFYTPKPLNNKVSDYTTNTYDRSNYNNKYFTSFKY